MLERDLVIGAHQGALEQAPDALYGVGMHLAVDPFLDAVVDGLVLGVGVLNSVVGAPVVGIDSLGRSATLALMNS